MQIFKSRTVWTVIVSFLLAGLQTLEGTFEPNVFLLIQAVLGALAVYFRANPQAEL